MRGAKIFVTLVFGLLAAAFMASTGLFLAEFGRLDPTRMLLVHSHLYLFFPLFGILALAAFFQPAVVFADMYWHNTPWHGRTRFAAGLLAVLAVSAATTWDLETSTPRGLWELTPAVLTADRGEAVQCTRGQCRRLPILDALGRLRLEAGRGADLSKFSRLCTKDALLEDPEDYAKLRHCFPAGDMLATEACCAVQSRFNATVSGHYADPAKRSDTARFDTAFLFLKTFFIVVVLVIGALLVARRATLENKYRDHAPAIERGLLVGAAAMLAWPIMDYAYHQTTLALFGRLTEGPHFRLSLAIVPWFMMVLFYFLQRFGRKLERWGQVGSIAASSLAIYRYEDANDAAVRIAGAGAPDWAIAAMAGLVLVGFLALRFPSDDFLARRRRRKHPQPAWT